MRAALRRALQAGVLGLGAPTGWMAIRAISGKEVWGDVTREPLLYAYLLLPTVFVMATLGALLGLREERLLTANRSLEELTVTDALTEMKNVRYFRARLEEEISRAQRTARPMALLIADVDLFKRVNDTYGHAVGDRLLREVAAAMLDVTRSGETVSRIGGEEFALILPGADPEEAFRAGERIRQAVARAYIRVPDMISVTISVGAASTAGRVGFTADDLYAAADEALYTAKHNGRDRIEVSSPPRTPELASKG